MLKGKYNVASVTGSDEEGYTHTLTCGHVVHGRSWRYDFMDCPECPGATGSVLFPWEKEEEERPFNPELACCEQAVRVFCVCRASYKCPVHGQTCHGSHE